MARAETITLLPLDRYFEIMRMDLCHANQVNGAKAPMHSGCDDVWEQSEREVLAETLATAEQMIADKLGFWPAPKWIVNEEIRLNRIRRDWWNAELATRWKHVLAFGTQKLNLIEADADVTYEDRKPDMYAREETAVIGEASSLYTYLSTSCADPCDVKAFFRVADGAWDAADPRWEIRPLKADVDGDSLTIVADSCMFVRPELWEYSAWGWPDGEWKHNFDINNFVDAVDLYCEEVDLGTPVTLYWEGVCNCTSPCAHTTQGACAYVTDWRRGHFAPRPSTWNGASHVNATPSYYASPVKIAVSYLAGYPLDERTCRMNPQLERAVVKLTNALLPEPPCGYCDMAERIWKRDRERVDPLTPEAASLPWDVYSQGALEAWRIVKNWPGTR